MKSFGPRALFPVYGVGVLGAFLQIAGAQWDVSAHILGIVETFFTPAHSVLYAGIGLVGLANLQGLRLRLAFADSNPEYASLFTGLRIAVLGTLLQLVAGPIDFYWHSTRGFDPYLFTPPHSLLILGVLIGSSGMTLGAIRLLQAQRLGQNITDQPWLLSLIVVTGLAALWGQFNFAGYWVTDLRGMAYTFGLCSIGQFYPPVSCGFVRDFDLLANLVSFAIFAISGTFFFWTAKKLFPKTGMATISGAILSLVYAALALGFLAYGLLFLSPPGSFYFPNPSPQQGVTLTTVIPLYLLSLVPLLGLDVAMRRGLTSRNLLIASALVGPLAAFIDGRYFLGILQSAPDSFLFIPVPTVIGGVLGGMLLLKLSHRIPLGTASATTLRVSPGVPTDSKVRNQT